MECRPAEEALNTICLICKTGRPAPGQTTVTLQRGDSTIIVKAVPADVCPNCGEYYLADDVSAKVLEQAEAAVRSGAEVEIRSYAA